jgi:hypothetical protein
MARRTLSETPLTKSASDASWIAQVANTSLNAWTYGDLREAVRTASETAASAFSYLTRGQNVERWQLPTASVLMVTENERGVIEGIDLGDCRVFALDSDGVQVTGGHDGLDDEVRLAAAQPEADKPLLKRKAAIETLRAQPRGDQSRRRTLLDVRPPSQLAPIMRVHGRSR